MKKKILHIVGDNNIVNNFLSFLNKNYSLNTKSSHKIILGNNISIRNFFNIFVELYKSKKIILHSLNFPIVLLILFFNPWILKKCYWVIWGGDLYYYKYRDKNFKTNIFEFVRGIVIKRIGNFITYIDGDYELAKKWYGVNGKQYECLMYQSNLYKNIKIDAKKNNVINILIGNSSTFTNNHKEIFNKLKKYKKNNIKIIVPLTYGCDTYRKEIIKLGKKYFGNKFIGLINFMNNKDYIKILSTIDIAIFNHNRQQAMGNTISLLGMGKKVYIRNNTVQWKLFKSLNINIYNSKNDFDDLFTELGDKKTNTNIEIIKNYFSEENLLKQWKNIFNN